MKTIVISYSLTGNNEALASSVAEELRAERIRITEPKPRTTGTIFLDLIFKRTPKIQQMPERLKNHDLVLFFGPVWIGQVATPLHAYLKQLEKNPCKYAFISICGGVAGPNPKLADELKNRTGREPAAVIDLRIASLLPPGLKPTMKTTSAYRLSNEDIKKLTDTVMKTLKEKVWNYGTAVSC